MKKTFKNRKKPLFLLFLFLLGMGIPQEVWATKYETTIIVTTQDIVKASGLKFYENGTSAVENNIQVKNGKVFTIEFDSNIIVDNDYVGKVERIDAHRFRVLAPGSIAFPCNDGSQDLILRVDVNYFGVLQASAGDAPKKIAVVKEGDGRLKNPPADGYVYLSEEEVLSVPAGKFEAITWQSSLENQNNFVNLHEITSNPSNMQLKQILLKSKEAYGNDQKNFDLRVVFSDGTSNAGPQLEDLGTSYSYVIIKDERVSTVPVAGVNVTPTSLNLTEGESFTLTGTVSPENASDKSVTWKTSDASIARVDGNGKVKAIKAGTVTITVTTNDGGFTARCEVTVEKKKVPVTGVKLSSTSETLVEGGSVTLIATVSPENASDKSVTWSSSNTSVATVSNEGVVSTHQAGKAVITVKTVDGGFTATCEVTVKKKVALNVVKAYQREVILSWTGLKENLDQFTLRRDNQEIQIVPYLDRDSVLITNLEPNTEYIFTLKRKDVDQASLKVTTEDTTHVAPIPHLYLDEELKKGQIVSLFIKDVLNPIKNLYFIQPDGTHTSTYHIGDLFKIEKDFHIHLELDNGEKWDLQYLVSEH